MFVQTVLVATVLFPFAKSLNHDPRILFGNAAQVGQFPYHAGIAALFPEFVIHCSGAIISADWILTTASCVQDAPGVAIHAGSVSDQRPDGVVTTAFSYKIHEDFDNFTLRNDIALVKVATPLPLSENISAVGLTEEDFEVGTVATITGWGHSNHDDTANRTLDLQFTQVSTIDNADCQRVYGSDTVTPGAVCTQAGDFGQGPCEGDAGGPLVVSPDNDRILIGIFSFMSTLGCELEYPAGYTRVSYYRNWIRDNSGV